MKSKDFNNWRARLVEAASRLRLSLSTFGISGVRVQKQWLLKALAIAQREEGRVEGPVVTVSCLNEMVGEARCDLIVRFLQGDLKSRVFQHGEREGQ